MAMVKKIKVPKKLEKDIQRECCDWLEYNKFFFWRSNNIPVFGRNNAGVKTFRSLPKHTPKGLPDIIVITNGKFIGLEIKRDGAKLRPDQAIFEENIKQNGGYYHVITNLDQLSMIMARYVPL
jgi:hypothetical protein